jgi:hypothetical protein
MQALIRTAVGALVREGTPVLKVVQDAAEPNATGRSLLDEIVRDGARAMLAAALRAEVAAYVAGHADQLDEQGHRLVVRNGYHAEREVTTAAGAVPVRAPRVNDRRADESTSERCRFCSAILPAWARKSAKVAEVLPLLYPHGLSSGDFVPALEQFLGSGAGLSASTVVRLTEQWQGRGGRVQRALARRRRRRLRVGRRDPRQGPARAGQGVPTGDDRGPRRRG